MDFLYESDLSLFGGDLLVDFPPAAVELQADQDGLKSHHDPITTSWQPSGAVLQHQDLHSDSPKSAQTGPIDEEWLDTKVDLLDLLTEDPGSLDLFSQLGAPGVDVLEIEAPRAGDAPDSCAAVEVMKSIAEETMQQLEKGEEEVTDMNVVNAQLLDVLVNSMDTSFDDIMEANLDLPVLSPVSAEDVESILSSEPVSPSAVSITDESSSGYNSSSTVDFSSFSLPQDAVVAGDLANLLQTVEKQPLDIPPTLPIMPPQPASRVSRNRAKPYEKPEVRTKDGPQTPKELKALERKMRKKQQNKDAATRYRNKKKAEANGINGECDALESRNTELKDKVDTMTREIKYLKNLLIEVYQAKGLAIPAKIK